MKHFDTNRVLNYDQLTPVQPTQAPSVQQPVQTQTRVSSKATPKKKTASDVRRELKQDTQERINRSRGAAPVHTVSKAKTR
ncbi:hypothetical protein [Bifidobacterium fermentum]|uniref:Uncharacterized protein n=1 Tax=Bifidobacterium fermentum TaxID=3059035 RepID=A0AB39UEY6_9BIFI